MTEYELFQKLEEANKALDTYKEEHKLLNATSIWNTFIKNVISDISVKSHVLGASGKPCSKCKGTGREF